MNENFKTIGFISDLAPEMVGRKMTWDDFKKAVFKTYQTRLPDFHQPMYDRQYLKRHCGNVSVYSENGNVIRIEFTLRPNPNEHQYAKKIPKIEAGNTR